MKSFYITMIILSVSISLVGTSSVFAPCLVGVTECGPPPGVTVGVGIDSQSYEKNDIMTIQGRVYTQNYTNPVTVQIISPNGTIVQKINSTVSNNTFSSKIPVNFDTTGLYQVYTCVQSWCDREYFKYISDPYKVTVNGQDFFIWYKTVADLTGIEADTANNALRVHIANGSDKITLTLPRALIDSKSGNSDSRFIVLVGMHQPDKYMQPANFTEIKTTSISRTIQIQIPHDDIANMNEIWDFKITPSQTLDSISNTELPLQQFREGITLENIQCKSNLVLLYKIENNFPACVRQNVADRLVSGGWGKSNPNTVLPESFVDCHTPYPQGRDGNVEVLYMPTNSIGKICVRYHNLNNLITGVGIRIFKADDLTKDAPEITNWASGNTLKDDATIVYFIKTGNKTGFYGISLFCGGIPLAVGYNSDSKIIANDFPWIGKVFNCPAQTYNYHIDSTEGIGTRYIPYTFNFP